MALDTLLGSKKPPHQILKGPLTPRGGPFSFPTSVPRRSVIRRLGRRRSRASRSDPGGSLGLHRHLNPHQGHLCPNSPPHSGQTRHHPMTVSVGRASPVSPTNSLWPSLAIVHRLPIGPVALNHRHLGPPRSERSGQGLRLLVRAARLDGGMVRAGRSGTADGRGSTRLPRLQPSESQSGG